MSVFYFCHLILFMIYIYYFIIFFHLIWIFIYFLKKVNNFIHLFLILVNHLMFDLIHLHLYYNSILFDYYYNYCDHDCQDLQKFRNYVCLPKSKRFQPAVSFLEVLLISNSDYHNKQLNVIYSNVVHELNYLHFL